LVASVTLLLLQYYESDRVIGDWKYLLAGLLLFLSFMMFSKVRYPSFKAVNWRTRRSIPKFIGIIVVLIFTVMNYEWMPAMIFIAYLLYGLARPLISQAWRREIETELGEDEENPTENRGA
jgi:CDP-diacylglycerol--serine O-phosphatidyltransferase